VIVERGEPRVADVHEVSICEAELDRAQGEDIATEAADDRTGRLPVGFARRA
jgi:hypothetical protein